MMKNKIITFKEACKYDEIAIELLRTELLNEHILHVIPVNRDPFFYVPDVDLLIVNEYYKIQTVEVKVDTYPAFKDANTGTNVKKIYLETIANDKKFSKSCATDGLGNALTSKADYFLYYFIELQSYLVIPTIRMQEWIRVNMPKGIFEIKSARTYGDDGQYFFSSYGMLVPIDVLIEQCGAKLCKSRTDWNTFKNHYQQEKKKAA